MQTSSKILLAFDEFKRQVIDLSARDLPFLRRHCGVDHGTIGFFGLKGIRIGFIPIEILSRAVWPLT